MSIDFSKWDKSVDLAGLQADIEDAKQKCNDEDMDIHASYVKIYDAEKVRNRVRTYTHSATEQKEFARSLREIILSQNEGKCGFSEMEKLNLGEMFIKHAHEAARKKKGKLEV